MRLALLLPLLGLVACGDPVLHTFFRTDEASRRPFLFAHRGGGGTLPESTLPALQEAHRADPLAILEFDVQRSRDGVLVVIHDGTVERTTDGRGAVADLTLAELKALDAGYCATPGEGSGTAGRGACDPAGVGHPFRGKGFQIPTLAEVLAGLPAEVFLSIEVKDAGIVDEFARAMRETGRLDRLATGAEDDDIAVRLKDRLPEAAHFLPRAAATCVALAAKLGLGHPDCPEYDVFASPTQSAGLALDTPEVIRAAHARGAAIVYWTINDEPTMERLLRLGADGLFTDYPQRARQVIDRLRTQGVWP